MTQSALTSEMTPIQCLQQMRRQGGDALTTGLNDTLISEFLEQDSSLEKAIERAWSQFQSIEKSHPELLDLSEREQMAAMQDGYVNFYADDAVNPYVTAGAAGPWIVSLKGAVLHDNGGYGMLGAGHAPDNVIAAMTQPHVMANIMTPNISQKRLVDALRAEIGHRRGSGCPFDKFLCLNSGSESVTVAARLADLNAKINTDPGGRHEGKTIKKLALAGAFHGRTDRPARFSDSSRRTYSKHLASFRDRDNLITVAPNDTDALRQAFASAEEDNVYIEAMFIEPVMGEGNPGQAITPEFYAAARELTRNHGSLLLVDSIQAGLRAHGVLSVVDYPGFENLDAPDMETYSKALNAGQYPLSVLAMSESTASLYRKGIYGNTMTTNPRACDVACTVLAGLNDELRNNIRDRGQEFLDKLSALKEELGSRITRVQGTGLLFSIELDGSRYKGFGSDSTEEYMRMHGINVIHGGVNSLRFTPHFGITSAEVDLVVDATRDALLNGPRRSQNQDQAAA